MKKINGDNALMTALKNNRLLDAKKLVWAGAAVDVINENGETPLILSVGPTRMHADVTIEILRAGADPNVRAPKIMGERQLPFLSLLVLNKYRDSSLEFALDHGADIDCRDPHHQETPLFLALRDNNFELVALLSKRGADFTVTNIYDQCPLSCIDTTNTLKGVQALETMLDNRLPPDTPLCGDKLAPTMMERAVRFGQTELMIPLLKRGADINRKNFFGKTPLMLGIDAPNVYRLLITNGADINIQDNEGLTAVMYAVHAKNSDALEFMLRYAEQKIDWSLKNKAGENARTMTKNLLNQEKAARVPDENTLRSLERALKLIDEEIKITQRAAGLNERG